jgi:hypothetical protein
MLNFLHTLITIIFSRPLTNSWDEWVPESRVLKYNEANVQLQKETQKKHENSAKSTKKASKTTKKT